jgi:Ca-activated chloride channel family protein
MRDAIACLALGLIGFAAVLGGSAPFGRLALGFGWPGAAAVLFKDPAWRGVAEYRAGRFAEAGAAFRAAGPGAAYNLGNALVAEGRYAAALEAYDVAKLQAPDPEAQANFDLIMALYAGTAIEAGSIADWSEDKDGATVAADIAQGSARATGSGDDVTNSGASIGQVELATTGERNVRKVFDDVFVVAGPRWLATLEDVPGAFLAERIGHEYKRRKAAGVGQPEADAPW